jgi:hypothetical protein
VGELAAVALPDVLTSGAEPQSFIFKVVTLLSVEVSPVQVMLSPIIIIPLFGARKISETQTGLCPPEILLGSMDLLQHDGLLEKSEQESALPVVLPEMLQLLWTC